MSKGRFAPAVVTSQFQQHSLDGTFTLDFLLTPHKKIDVKRGTRQQTERTTGAATAAWAARG
jgi:hypothetical protein